MALTIPTTEHWNCKLRWRLAGDPEEMICTIGVRCTIGEEPTSPEVAERVYLAWEGAFEDTVLSSNYTLVGCDVQKGPAPATEVASYDQLTPGAHGNPVSVQNTCILVKKKTSSAGAANTGRMYLPAGYLPESEVDDTGRLLTSYQIALNGYIQQFYDNLLDGNGVPSQELTPMLYHASREGIAGGPPTVITGFSIDPVVATQRQRLRR